MGVRGAVLGLRPYQAGKPISEVKRELGLTDVIKLASNENPLGCSENVKSIVREMAERLCLYPDASNYELKKTLANNLGVDTNNIFCSTGSDLLIRYLCSIYVEPGDETIMGSITFQRYDDGTKLMGGVSVKIPMKNHGMDIEAMVNAITDRTRIIWFCTPNNPTGAIVKKEELFKALDKVPNDVIIVMDEAYYEYVTDEDYPQTIPLINKYKNMVILRTFSKAYGLAGLRLGYGIANEEIAKYLNAVIGPFDSNSVAQAAAVEAIKDKDFLKRVIDENTRGREYLSKEFEKMGLEYIKTHANFIMVNTREDDREVFDKLLRKGIIIRPGYLFEMPQWLRVSIGTMEQNERFVKGLEEILY